MHLAHLDYHHVPEKRQLSEQDELRGAGFQRCHTCRAVQPQEFTLCFRCDAFLGLHVVASKMNEAKPE